MNQKRKIIYPQKCSKCGESFAHGSKSHVLKYAVSGCQLLNVDEEGRTHLKDITRPAPTVCMCSSCGTRFFPEIIKDGGPDTPKVDEKPKRGRPRKTN